MHTELREFLSQFVGAVMMTLIPVIFIAFVSMPMALNRHPGEPPASGQMTQHMT